MMYLRIQALGIQSHQCGSLFKEPACVCVPVCSFFVCLNIVKRLIGLSVLPHNTNIKQPEGAGRIM